MQDQNKNSIRREKSKQHESADIRIEKITYCKASNNEKKAVNANFQDIKLCPIGKVIKFSGKKKKQKNVKAKKEDFKEEQLKDKSWIILNKSEGENFVLQNLKNTEAEDFFIKGMPEAGKKEPWNIIKIKKGASLAAEKKENHYILDDFDNLKEIAVETFDRNPIAVKRYDIAGREKFITSPYVLNLRKNSKEEEASTEGKFSNLKKDFLELANKKNRFIENIKNEFSRLESSAHEKVKALKRINAKADETGEIDDLDFEPEKFSFVPAVIFAMVALLLVLPVLGTKFYLHAQNIKGRVLGDTEEAVNNLRLGKDLISNTSLGSAKQKFSQAENGFNEAQGALNELNKSIYNLALTLLNKNEEVKTANALTEAGKNAAEISNIFLNGLESLGLRTDSRQISTSTEDVFKNGNEELKSGKILEFIAKFNRILALSAPKFKSLQASINQINKDLIPAKYEKNFEEIEDLISLVRNKFEDYEKYSEVLMKILAKDSEGRYLFLFQNNNELRPTGGFIGSYALIDIKNGEIKNMEIPGEGSYYLQGSLLKNIEPPRPLRLINSRWEFQDANWWPDFPTSADSIANIYEKSGGPTVDGVIAINASLLKELFQVIGPVELPRYDKVIDANNFFDEIQKEAELEYDKKENKPKQIITELMPIVLKRLFELDEQKLLDIIKVFDGALLKRDIQIFSEDEDLEKDILKLGWGGEIKDIKNRDYLAVFDTNIGGRKTDSVIESSMSHETKISEDGSVIDELFITKKHQGIKGDFFTGVNNVSYVRIYVPRGAILLEAEGFDPPPAGCFKDLKENSEKDDFLNFSESAEKTDLSSETVIGEMFGKTYFANWMQVNPGEERTIRVKYKLPFSILDNGIGKYSLYIQKQAGSNAHTITKKLEYPKNFNVIWAYPESPCENVEWIKDDSLENDKFYGAVFTRG